MREHPSDIAFTPAVKAIQERKGSRRGYAHMESGQGWETKVTPELAEFISELDMFYLGTASAESQPYIQYRGGSPGFLKIIDEQTLGFGDFGGNQQYITLGNLSENPRAFLFLMDYANRSRIKIWGTAHVIEGDKPLNDKLHNGDYPTAVQRAIVFTVEAWDINCHQHIHPRFSQRQLAPIIGALEDRVRELENQLLKHQQSDSRSTAK